VRSSSGWNALKQSVAVQPHTDYTLRGWVRTSANNTAALQLVTAKRRQLPGTPFERHLRSSKIEISLAEDGGETDVAIASEQSLRGMSRLGSPMMRRGQGEILDEALDGIERALT